MIVITLILTAITMNEAYAHSWIECVSYDPPSFDYQSLGSYDNSRCTGYPRGFKTQFKAGFGVDTGYNWEHPDCSQNAYNADDYTNQIPMASYKPGQTIYISHPSKNHVASSECTNVFIPSTSMNVFMSTRIGHDTFDYSLPIIGGEHVNGVEDHLSYQRCFDFCNNQDKAHCLTGWVLPTDIPEGIYSFKWLWQFNPNQFYSNCFDAYIGNSINITGSLNTSSSDNDITIQSTIGVPYPTPSATTPVTTTPVTITPVTTTPVTTTPVTTTPVTTTPIPDVISSSASSISSPFTLLHSYIMNISGYMNITISEVARTMRIPNI